MHPRAAAAFADHIERHLAPGEEIEAGVRAVTGGFVRRQNMAVLGGLTAYGGAIALRFAALDWRFYGWLEALLLPVFIVPAILLAHRRHARARARIGGAAPGDSVRRQSALLLAVSDRRLLVFARKGSARFGELLADYPLRAIRAVRRVPARAFPVRLPAIEIELVRDGTIDLELLAIDRAEDFLEALDEGRQLARRRGRD
jgi:hypothetical protein